MIIITSIYVVYIAYYGHTFKLTRSARPETAGLIAQQEDADGRDDAKRTKRFFLTIPREALP